MCRVRTRLRALVVVAGAASVEPGAGSRTPVAGPHTPASATFAAAAVAHSMSLHDGDSAAPHAADDNAYWMQPPPASSSGEPIWVDFRFNLNKVSTVDTVAGTAFVDFAIVWYWTDPRLAGWPVDTELPPRLWGPKIELKNGLGDVQEEDITFALVNSAANRLQRFRRFTGTVDNPMDLRNFPFDMDRIELQFSTYSLWSSLDNEKTGYAMKGRSYRMRPVRELGEGDWLWLGWSGAIGEWSLHGVSTKVEEQPAWANGTQQTNIPVSFHVTRKSSYYFWKALLPLYLLFALSMTTFQFDTDNLEARLAQVSTHFIAAFAMLYVVGASLPKTDFLTKIDVVVVLTTVSLAFTGVASSILTTIHADSGEDVAKQWNLRTVVCLALVYVLSNIWIFAPPCVNQLRATRQLTNFKRLPVAKVENGIASSGTDVMVEAQIPLTVEPGCDYFTLEDIKAGQMY